MLLPNCLVLVSIYCMVVQDVDGLPRPAKVSPSWTKQGQILKVTQTKNQDLLAKADSSAKLGSEAIRMFPKRIHFDVPKNPRVDNEEGFQLWAQPDDDLGEDQTPEPTPTESSEETSEASSEPDGTTSDSEENSTEEDGESTTGSEDETTSDSDEENSTESENGDSTTCDLDNDTLEPDGDNNNKNTTKGAGSKTTTPKTGAGGELTVSVPQFTVDKMGNWVYNPWGVTFGQVWLDTRFNFRPRPTMPRMVIDSKAPFDYYPKNEGLSTVCIGRSTVYNRPRIDKWLPRKIVKFKYDHRPIWLEVRRELYKLGNSEECHAAKYSDWMSYQLCALRRNQRMEYYLPKYPMQQM